MWSCAKLYFLYQSLRSWVFKAGASSQGISLPLLSFSSVWSDSSILVLSLETLSDSSISCCLFSSLLFGVVFSSIVVSSFNWSVNVPVVSSSWSPHLFV